MRDRPQLPHELRVCCCVLAVLVATGAVGTTAAVRPARRPSSARPSSGSATVFVKGTSSNELSFEECTLKAVQVSLACCASGSVFPAASTAAAGEPRRTAAVASTCSLLPSCEGTCAELFPTFYDACTSALHLDQAAATTPAAGADGAAANLWSAFASSCGHVVTALASRSLAISALPWATVVDRTCRSIEPEGGGTAYASFSQAQAACARTSLCSGVYVVGAPDADIIADCPSPSAAGARRALFGSKVCCSGTSSYFLCKSGMYYPMQPNAATAAKCQECIRQKPSKLGQRGLVPKPVDECNAQPPYCQNGGRCTFIEDIGMSCLCDTSQRTVTGKVPQGDRCEQLVDDPCKAAACINEAECVLTVTQGGGLQSSNQHTARCICTSSSPTKQLSFGTRCEHVAVNPCATSPCLNGGSCQGILVKAGAQDGMVPDFTCFCAHSATLLFGGKTCADTPPNPCSSAPCQNGGICHTTDTTSLPPGAAPGPDGTISASTGSHYGYQCECPPRWEGGECGTRKTSSEPCTRSPSQLCAKTCAPMLCDPGFCVMRQGSCCARSCTESEWDNARHK